MEYFNNTLQKIIYLFMGIFSSFFGLVASTSQLQLVSCDLVQLQRYLPTKQKHWVVVASFVRPPLHFPLHSHIPIPIVYGGHNSVCTNKVQRVEVRRV
jgi:hypothetical protein